MLCKQPNIIFAFAYRKPVVCGVTSLGMDHVETLGGSLESIAWQKAGIFKVGKLKSVIQPML